MQIFGGKPPGKQDVYLKTQKAGGGDAVPDKAQADRTSGADRVELSGRGKELAEMKNVISQLPEVRNDKVQEIGKMVSDGTYRPDSGKIAGRMIDELV